MNKRELLAIIILFVFSFLIRIIGLDKYPPGLYTDEVAVGYSAYSVLTTGKDEFGNLFPLAFKSFNDYKAPVYIYSVIPSILVFGLNELGVRFPSAFFSSLTVVVVYLLCWELTKERREKKYKYFSLVSAILVSLLPLHFTFSRIAFEGNMSLFFTCLGVYLFLVAGKKGLFYSLSFVSFSLSIYSYHSARLVAPLLVLGLVVIFWDKVKANLKGFLVGVLVAFIFSLPLIITTLTHFDEIVRRPANISIFKDKGVEGKIWEAQIFDAGMPIWLVRVLHNKPYYYFISFVRNYFTHFSGGYLFLYGDLGEHFRVPNAGGLYLVMLPFLLIGLVNFIRKDGAMKKVILLWLILSPVAAAFTFMVPSGHRNLNMIVPFCMITSFGVLVWAKTKKRRFMVAILFTVNVLYFGYQYFWTAPMTMARDWNWGYKEAVGFIGKVKDEYGKIVLTNDSGESYMHFAFYLPFRPEIFQEKISDLPADRQGFDEIDKFGIGHIYKIGKFKFRNIDWEKEDKEEGVLWIGTDSEIPDGDDSLNYLKTIYYPNGSKAFEAVE